MILIIALFINLLSSISGQQLHDLMTKEEKELIFQVEHDKVHTVQYEVVPLMTKRVSLRMKNEIPCPRSATPKFEKPSVYLTTFGGNFELYLEENDNVLFGDQTPVIKPYIDSDGKIKYNKRDYNLIPALKMSAYHDRKKRAAVTMYTDENGRMNMNGIINDTLIIRSIPERLHEEVLNKNLNLSTTSRALNETHEIHHHIVIKRDIRSNSNKIKIKFIRSQSKKKEHKVLNRKRRGLKLSCLKSPSEDKQFIVYPKILIVLDYASYQKCYKNLIECTRHTLAYWNVADLRYREMEKPKIRLNIAGIIIATEENVIPYMEKKKASATARYDIEALQALQGFFAKENVTQIDYDIVVGVSPWRLVDRGSWWQPIYKWFTNTESSDVVYGIASSKSICRYPREAVALVRDGSDFMNANVAAHEIGHILGLGHDPMDLREDDPDYKSHWEHGFLMSYRTSSKNQMHWSDLSIRKMQKFLQKKENNHCLLRKPKVGTPYRKILPGKFVSRDEVCRNFFGPASHSLKNSLKIISDCLKSYCYFAANATFLEVPVPVPEGSFCGVGKICIEGECVKDPTDRKVYRDLSMESGSAN